MRATNSPSETRRLTPRRAHTAAGPVPYTLVRSRTSRRMRSREGVASFIAPVRLGDDHGVPRAEAPAEDLHVSAVREADGDLDRSGMTAAEDPDRHLGPRRASHGRRGGHGVGGLSRRRDAGEGPVEEGGDRDGEDVGPASHDDGDLRRHARLEASRRVVDGHHGVVGDHVLDDGGVHADLADRPPERDVRVGGHRDARGLSGTDPTSASSTEVSTCMSVRLLARVKRVGVWKEAATVWPTLTLRAMTIPSMGLVITVRERLYCACRSWADWAATWCRAAERWASAVRSCARALSRWLMAASTWARAVATAARAARTSWAALAAAVWSASTWFCGMNPWARRARSLSTVSRARASWLCALAAVAWALSRAAVAWRRVASAVWTAAAA